MKANITYNLSFIFASSVNELYDSLMIKSLIEREIIHYTFFQHWIFTYKDKEFVIILLRIANKSRPRTSFHH